MTDVALRKLGTQALVLQGKLQDACLGVQQLAEGVIALRLQGMVLLLKIPVS